MNQEGGRSSGPDRHRDNRHSNHNNKPYHGGYDNRRGGYDNRRGGYDNRRGGYDNRRGNHDRRRPQETPPDIIASVTKLFNKCYKFKSSEYTLPKADTWFTNPPFQVDTLQDYKRQLNTTKNLLNDKDKDIWHRHTRFTNPAGNIMRTVRQKLSAELLTQAWAKYYEMANKLVPDKPKFTSVHICEAPGGFICANNHYLKRNRPDCDWSWFGMTLNPYFEGNSSKEMVDDDLFISKTYKNWYFGADNTGNIMNRQNIADLKQRIKQQGNSPVLLVTADGSIDCQDNPNEQEATVAHLHYCETISALSLLEPGGNFLLKGFTLFEHSTLCLTYLLVCVFEQVQIVKPLTSKSGNSETYTICTGYRGVSSSQLETLQRYHSLETPDNAFFALSDIAPTFLEEFQHCSHIFMSYQRNMIQSNIDLFDNFPKDKKDELYKTKNYAVEHYLKHACKGLDPIDSNQRLVQSMLLDGTKLNTTAILSSDGRKGSNRRMQTQSHSEQQKERGMSWFERVVRPLLTPISELLETQTVAEKIMAQMGFEKGHGLGKSGEGRQDPISVQQLAEGTGLGYSTPAISSIVVSSADAVQWFKQTDTAELTLSAIPGRTIPHVTNSRFLTLDTLEKLNAAERESSVIRQNDLAHLAQSVHPYYTLENVSGTYKRSDVQLAYLNKLTNTITSGSTCIDISHSSKFVSYLDKLNTKTIELSDDDLDSLSSIKKFSDEIGHHKLDLVIADCSSKHRLLAGVLLTLKHMKSGGHCIVHFSRLHNRFNVSIVYLLTRLFQTCAIIKTKACSPHAPELFVVAKVFQGNSDNDLEGSVVRLIEGLEYLQNQNRDVVEILPISLLFSHQFYKFISESNERISLEAFDTIIDLEKYACQNSFPTGKSNTYLMECINETGI